MSWQFLPKTVLRLGYADVTTFIEAFRRWKGMPPSEFRRSQGLPGYTRRATTGEAYTVPVADVPLLTRTDFNETPAEIRSEVKIAGSLRLRSSRKTDIPVVDLLDYLRLHPNLKPADHAWLHTKLHGRLAAPWTCLVVVLIAIPFGAPSGRRNVFVGVAGSIFIAFGYFVLQQFCLALGSGGHLIPWVAAWLPNFVFALAAIILIRRVR